MRGNVIQNVYTPILFGGSALGVRAALADNLLICQPAEPMFSVLRISVNGALLLKAI